MALFMPPSYLTTYKVALDALSARTRTPLPSLLVSFALLHELTAVVPLVAVFYGSRSLGIGDTVLSTIINNPPQGNSSGIRKVVQTWVEEGDAWAARIGRRYGVFGYEKRTPGEVDTPPDSSKLTSRLAGDVANAVVAYGVTKALLPVRIGFSLYLSPAFSRGVVEPFRKTLIQSFRRRSP